MDAEKKGTCTECGYSWYKCNNCGASGCKNTDCSENQFSTGYIEPVASVVSALSGKKCRTCSE